MAVTLADLCEELNNWFDTKEDGTKDRWYGTIKIEDGAIDLSEINIKTNQYFRVIGSVFNDGVYQYPTSDMVDEEFDGAIWIMYVPKQVVTLLDDINVWNDKYGPVIETPFNSESFGGYSYYKGYKNTTKTVASSWRTQFKYRTNKWRKLQSI